MSWDTPDYAKVREYVARVGNSASQLLNAAVLLGHPNESISGRSYLNRDRMGWKQAYHAINLLFWVQDDHCKTAHQDDLDWAKQYVADNAE